MCARRSNSVGPSRPSAIATRTERAEDDEDAIAEERWDGVDPDRVLLLNGNSQCALSIVRALARKGVDVTVGSAKTLPLGRVSKYAADTYRYPAPEDDYRPFLRHLISYLETSDHAAVIPALGKLVVVLARHKAEIEARTGTVVATESWDTFERVYDKARLPETTERAGVPAPETWSPASVDDLESVADRVDYPAVVKPRSKSVWDGDRRHTYHTVQDDNYVESREELVETYRALVAANPPLTEYPPVVQEYVPGTTTATVVLADEGTVEAHFQEERVRTYPSSGGNSTLLRPLEEPRMLEYTERVMEALSWTGPAMAEFKRTPDGEFQLIEVNGRYWGSLPFAINAGVNFPWLHYQLLLGNEPSRTDTYRTDFRQRRLFYEDIKWLGECLQRGDLAAVWPFLRDFATADHTFVSLDDPAPTALTLGQALALGLRTVADRVRDGREGGAG